MRRTLPVLVAAYVATLAVLFHLDFRHRSIWLFAVASLLYLVCVFALRRFVARPRTVALVVLGVGAALQIVALTRAPLTSDDANRYAWDAKVQLSGTDPYRYAPQDPQLAHLRDDVLFGPASACSHPIPGGCTSINRPSVHTVYPPVAQAAFDVGRIVSIGWRDARHGVLVFQVLGALGVTAVGWLLTRRLLARGLPVWPVALWSWCPIVVSEFGNNAHLDWLGVLLTVLALDAGAGGKDRRAGILAGLAIATKLYPALVVPALMRRRPWLVVAAAAGTVVLVYVPHLIVAGKDVLGYLPGYLDEEGYGTGARFALLGQVLPHPADGIVAVALLAAAAWWCYRRSDPLAPEQAATVLTGLTFLVVTPGYGWYAALLVGLAVLSQRYEWIALAAAPSFGYLIRSDTHDDSAGAWSYAIAAAVTLLVWLWRMQRGTRSARMDEPHTEGSGHQRARSWPRRQPAPHR